MENRADDRARLAGELGFDSDAPRDVDSPKRPSRLLQLGREEIIAPKMRCAGIIGLGLFCIVGVETSLLARSVPPSFEAPRATWKGPKPPWPRRRRTGVTMRAKGQGLVDLSRWPAEPASPKDVDQQALAATLRQACGWMPPGRSRRYAGWIVAYARQFGVDPFLLGGFILRQSMCLPRNEDNYGVGLAGIHEKMHSGFVRGRKYRYWIFVDGLWRQRELDISRFLFYRRNLRRAEPSIYFSAALMSIYKQQCKHLDGAFGSVPHRHFVSHMVWGDRVRDAGPEDRILRARRRLLQYYHSKRDPKSRPAPPRGDFQGLPLRCPLDAPPRKITSVMGDDRSAGARRHRGVDFSSSWGEPVYAVADGVVIKAGVDFAGARPTENLSPEEAKKVPRSKMGAGGLFVMIRHAKGLVSAYMHLSSYAIEQGDKVRGGQLVGQVGKTGIRESTAHLHFELRHGGQHIDPAPHLASYIFLPEDTYLGRKLGWEQKRVRRRRRIKRWRQQRLQQRESSSAK